MAFILVRQRLRPILPKRLQLTDFSPFVRQEYRFRAYPKQPGAKGTLATIVGANAAVWAAWQVAYAQALDGDESMVKFMNTHFVGSNRNTSDIENLHKIVLCSFSHQDFGHLSGNMMALLLLAPKLHEFLGRARFMALYFAGSIGGTMATQALHLDPYWEEAEVARSPQRYCNILQGKVPGEAAGLGASDAIAALFACFYLTFPRQPVPFLWTKANIAWSFLPQRFRDRVPLVGRLLNRTKAAAIYVLPAFFFIDFVKIWQRLTGPQEDAAGLMLRGNVGHAAHVGGFLAGTAFYGLVAHRLKGQFFHFTRHEMLNRAYVMTLSTSFWYGVSRLMARGEEKAENTAGARKVTFWLDGSLGDDQASQEETKPEETRTFELPRAMGQLWKNDSRLPQLVQEANICCMQETCVSGPLDGRSGKCDAHFAHLRKYLDLNTTAPNQAAQLLSPTFIDSIEGCREVLRGGVSSELVAVHQDYRRVNPPIHEVIIPGQRRLGLITSMLPSLRSPHDPLAACGLKVTELDGCLQLSGIAKGSQAQGANAVAYVGDIITHVCNTPVATRADAVKAARGQSQVHIWLERRGASNAEKAPPANVKKLADPSRLREQLSGAF